MNVLSQSFFIINCSLNFSEESALPESKQSEIKAARCVQSTELSTQSIRAGETEIEDIASDNDGNFNTASSSSDEGKTDSEKIMKNNNLISLRLEENIIK